MTRTIAILNETVTAKVNNTNTLGISHTEIATSENVEQRIPSCAVTNYSKGLVWKSDDVSITATTSF